jgi:hypothetical protein
LIALRFAIVIKWLLMRLSALIVKLVCAWLRMNIRIMDWTIKIIRLSARRRRWWWYEHFARNSDEVWRRRYKKLLTLISLTHSLIINLYTYVSVSVKLNFFIRLLIDSVLLFVVIWKIRIVTFSQKIILFLAH